VTQQQPEASRIVEDTGIRILDELAVEGGRATRAHLFDKCQGKLWGHVANVAARRAGYTGRDEAEVERHGKEQLFMEAVNLLLEREQIVIWDDAGDLLALHPTHRDEYIPGTNLWRSQRQLQLTELRTQLLQFRDRHVIGDQSFDAMLRKASALYAQQLRRGQLAGTTREEALMELLALADVLFDPARLAELLGVEESEIRAVAARRLQPPPTVAPSSKRKPTRQQAPTKESARPQTLAESPQTSEDGPPTLEEDPQTLEGAPQTSQNYSNPATLRREREARELSLKQLSQLVGISDTALGNWEKGRYAIKPFYQRQLHEYFTAHPVPNGQAS
jgi:ribosome-binding protein aMBF1 (putative translation factor)